MRCHNLIRTRKTWVMWFTAVATNVTASDASSFAPTMPRPSHIAMTQVARPVESLLIIETKAPDVVVCLLRSGTIGCCTEASDESLRPIR